MYLNRKGSKKELNRTIYGCKLQTYKESQQVGGKG